jgi:hypothetical protein
VTDTERRRRVEDVCDAALNRDARERATFVAAACGFDEALRQEVEERLAHAQTAEGLLDMEKSTSSRAAVRSHVRCER